MEPAFVLNTKLRNLCLHHNFFLVVIIDNLFFLSKASPSICALEPSPSHLLTYIILDLMPDDLRWSWCNSKNKVHNKCNAFESSPNHLHPHPWKNCHPRNRSLVPKRLGTAALYYQEFILPCIPLLPIYLLDTLCDLQDLSSSTRNWTCAITSLGAQTVKNPPAKQEMWVQSLGQEYPLEEGIATHSSIPAWRIPWTEEPDEL